MSDNLRQYIQKIVATWAILYAGLVPMARADVVFPPGANVVDITKAPYNATPNDDGDDTAAIQKALTDNVNLIYIPNGTYTIHP